ncbi:MAG: large repetitive protein [Chthoniobacter sp.]|jgi:hypothetical protein|nr:large repetitive protein [Chthoniobacter sp.]
MPAPSAPTGLAVAESAILWVINNNGTIKVSNKAAALLSFTNSAPTTAQHRIEYSVDGGTTWLLGTIVGIGATQALVRSLPLSTPLDFRAKAQDEDGDSGYATLSWTSPAMATTGSPPTVPSSFAVSDIDSSRATFTWEDQSTNEAFFEIQLAMTSPSSSRVERSVYVDDLSETTTIDLRNLFGSYFSGYSIANQFVDARIRAVGGAGTSVKRPSVTSVWSGTITFKMGPPAILVTSPYPGSTVNLETGAATSITIRTNTPATTWSADALPTGLTLTDDEISGTPTTAGITTTVLTVGDGVTTGAATIRFAVAASSIRFLSLPTARGKLGQAFTYNIVARVVSGTALPITFTADNLPSFLSLSGSAITGTPTEDGEFTFVITAHTDRASNSLTVTMTVAALEFESGETLSAAIGQEFRQKIVTSPTGAEFELVGAPAWLEIEDGVLAGTPPDNTLAELFTFDIIATIGESSASQTFTLTVGELFLLDDPIEGATGRHLLEYVTYEGAGSVTDWWLSNAPEGLELWDMADGGYGPAPLSNRRAIRGAPTQAGLFRATISAQVVRDGVFECYSIDFVMLVKGGLFLPWFHNDAYRLDLQVPLRGDVSRRGVRSHYETAATPASTSTTTTGDTTIVTKVDAVSANLLTLKRGDKTTLGIIFRDGIDTTVAGISEVKMTLREKDAEDGEYVFELTGTPATLDGFGYFTTTIEVESDALNDAMGDDSIVSLQLLGEISFVHAGEARSSASFPVTIVEDIER